MSRAGIILKNKPLVFFFFHKPEPCPDELFVLGKKRIALYIVIDERETHLICSLQEELEDFPTADDIDFFLVFKRI